MAGFPPQQAGDTAEALAEAFGELATKGDIAGLQAETKSDIAALQSDIAGVKREIVALRAELDIKLELLRRDMTIRLGGMIAIGVGVIVGAMRLFTMHP